MHAETCVGHERERLQVGPEVGPTSAFYRCVPRGMHGPTCILWANLTPFWLAAHSSRTAACPASTGAADPRGPGGSDGGPSAPRRGPLGPRSGTCRRERARASGQYHITRPLAPPYSLHTVLLKVEPYDDTPKRLDWMIMLLGMIARARKR